jgi:hypothetical protein
VLVPAHPDRRFLVAVDMEKYSRQDNLRQYQSQRTLKAVMREAVDEVGLDRVNWVTQSTGDGELAILPTGTPEPAVVGGLVPTIERILREHNRSLIPEAKVRLRIALHQGLVHLDGANGFPAEAIVTVCRLLDARPLKRALAAFTGAAAALIVSDQIFHDVVAHRYGGLRPERFRRVQVRLPDKDFGQQAWICVPDEDVNQLDELDGPDLGADCGPHANPNPGGDISDQSRQRPNLGSAMYTIQDTTTNGPTVFGPHGTAAGSINWDAVSRGDHDRGKD